jgi:dihydrodipicolinate synthase/N-acetylneuraminate lyase
MPKYPQPPEFVSTALREGQVIPACPLALTDDRQYDEHRQRVLTRYYHAAGAGGLAVGVHTTQFEIRSPEHNFFDQVLSTISETIQACDRESNRQTIQIAGICGKTPQAIAEAQTIREYGYHLGLLSLAALSDDEEDALLQHCWRVAQEVPLLGFYLQPSVGGRLLSKYFWRQFIDIPNVIGIKIAPFNRYQTLDVVHALAESGRANEVVLYTGNDDNIVIDLLTRYEISTTNGPVQIQIAGGLLGHWACWTRTAVDLLNRCKEARLAENIPSELLTLAAQITDCNAAFFDAANHYAGVIPGIHEVLRRQGLLQNIHCLDPHEQLSDGQAEEINRVNQAYPHLNDDDFVRANLANWMER